MEKKIMKVAVVVLLCAVFSIAYKVSFALERERSMKSTKTNTACLVSEARMTGYYETCIQLAHEYGSSAIDEEAYNEYIRAKNRYEEEKNLENFSKLSELARSIYDTLQ